MIVATIFSPQELQLIDKIKGMPMTILVVLAAAAQRGQVAMLQSEIEEATQSSDHTVKDAVKVLSDNGLIGRNNKKSPWFLTRTARQLPFVIPMLAGVDPLLLEPSKIAESAILDGGKIAESAILPEKIADSATLGAHSSSSLIINSDLNSKELKTTTMDDKIALSAISKSQKVRFSIDPKMRRALEYFGVWPNRWPKILSQEYATLEYVVGHLVAAGKENVALALTRILDEDGPIPVPDPDLEHRCRHCGRVEPYKPQKDYRCPCHEMEKIYGSPYRHSTSLNNGVEPCPVCGLATNIDESETGWFCRICGASGNFADNDESTPSD